MESVGINKSLAEAIMVIDAYKGASEGQDLAEGDEYAVVDLC